MDHEKEPGYIATGVLRGTLWGCIAALSVGLGSMAVVIVDAAGAQITSAVTVAAVGLIGVALIVSAALLASDVRARAGVKAATFTTLGVAAAGSRAPLSPLVEVNIRRATDEVADVTTTKVEEVQP